MGILTSPPETADFKSDLKDSCTQANVNKLLNSHNFFFIFITLFLNKEILAAYM